MILSVRISMLSSYNNEIKTVYTEIHIEKVTCYSEKKRLSIQKHLVIIYTLYILIVENYKLD